MINFKLEKSMYDKFIDKSELTTKELLELGFNSHDLTKLVEDGKIRRVRRGVYDLENCEGLFTYAKILASKRNRDFEKFEKAIKRCLEIDPNNGSVHTKLFLDSLYKNNFEQVFESYKVMSGTDNEAYKRDMNLWLYLLSFVTEIPDEYKDKVSKFTLDDLLTLEDDQRYEDRASQNKIRNAVFSHKFNIALELQREAKFDKKYNNIFITEKLLDMALYADKKSQYEIYDLVVNGKYEEVRDILLKNASLHGLSATDNQILLIVEDLINVINTGVVPSVEDKDDSNYLLVEIKKHNYKRALELYKDFVNKKVSKNTMSVGLLLEKINEEINKLESVEVKEELPKKTLSVGSDIFANIANSLLVGDVDKAFLLLDQYLESIGKKKYKNYIANLIKLDVLNEDKSFVESMHELSCLSREKPLFDVAVCIQDFYFSLINKNFKKAAVFLNLISMSKALGGVEVDVNNMRRTLIDEAFKYKVKESDLGLLGVEEVKEMETYEDVVEVPVVEEVKEEELPIVYTLADAMEDVLQNVNLLMLEPMSDEEIQFVVNTTQETGNIQSIVVEEETGDKRVFLRYIDINGPYVDISNTLRFANYKFKERQYEEAIDLFQSVLPKLENPRSFIYGKLGIAYRNITRDGDYSKAIDYLTLATAASQSEEEVRDYTDLINRLKFRTNYNGVVLTKKDN